MQSRFESTATYLKNILNPYIEQAQPLYNRSKEIATSLQANLHHAIEYLKFDDVSDADIKQLTEINNAIQTLKGLDSTKQLTSEMDEAIKILQQWKDTRVETNRAYSPGGLIKKFNKTNEQIAFFDRAKIATMGLSAANILLMFYVFAKNEDRTYSNYAFLDMLCKMPLRAITMIGALEGSIHLYKAKRFFIDKSEIAKAELAVIRDSYSEKEEKITPTAPQMSRGLE
ncbi:MAG: hypothetical protein SFW66_01515 [Gammaproteobacteria bacterium]|nr:hypothetical protein [Gammaproteobacteria bacterium]